MLREEIRAFGRKILSLLLMFNSLVSLVFSLSTMYGVLSGHLPNNLYRPYLVSTLLLFSITLTATLNIIPVKFIGKADIRRRLFHHYIYGFFSILFYLVLVALLSLINVSAGNNQYMVSGQIYLAIPLYWGIALIIDDLPDLSPRIRDLLNAFKIKVSRISNMIMWVHRVSSIISIYVLSSIILWYTGGVSVAKEITHIMFVISSLITAICGIKISSGKVWLKYFSGA